MCGGDTESHQSERHHSIPREGPTVIEQNRYCGVGKRAATESDSPRKRINGNRYKFAQKFYSRAKGKSYGCEFNSYIINRLVGDSYQPSERDSHHCRR